MSQVEFGDSSTNFSTSGAPLSGPAAASGSSAAAAPAKKKARGIDIYTMLLILSLLSLLVGLVLLYIELKAYGGQYAPGKAVPFVF